MARLMRRLAGSLGGVRGRMLVLLLVAGIPVTGIALSNALRDHATVLEDGRRALFSARANLAVREIAVLDAADALLRTLARLDLAEEERCPDTLRRARDPGSTPLAEIRLSRADGTLLCAPDGRAGEHLDEALSALARDAAAASGPVLGAFVGLGDPRSASLPIAVPVWREADDARPRTVVLGTVALRELTPAGV